MLSYGPVLGPNSFQNINLKKYSFKNFRACVPLHQQFKEIAIRHISGNLLKSLMAIKGMEFVDARNRVEVPHGLFDLSLEHFYARRKENIVYLDVLQLVCHETLEQAKVCIVLDDLQSYVSRLFNGYHTKKMGPILNDISNSQKLLTISETIALDYKRNSDIMSKLREKLNAFHVRETNAIAYMNGQVYGVQNNCAEAELVLDPIEFRYKLNYHYRTTDQSEQKLRQVEESLQEQLNKLDWTRTREGDVSDSIRVKQKKDIDILKLRLEEMTRQYDQDYDSLDGQISYKINGMEAMRDQHRDCIAKLDFYAVEVERLKEWAIEWEIKKHQEASRASAKKPKKGGKKK